MSYTSTAVKRKYNEKTYKRWSADLRIEDFEKIETMRLEISQLKNKDISRAKFLKTLVDFYKTDYEMGNKND